MFALTLSEQWWGKLVSSVRESRQTPKGTNAHCDFYHNLNIPVSLMYALIKQRSNFDPSEQQPVWQ